MTDVSTRRPINLDMGGPLGSCLFMIISARNKLYTIQASKQTISILNSMLAPNKVALKNTVKVGEA